MRHSLADSPWSGSDKDRASLMTFSTEFTIKNQLGWSRQQRHGVNGLSTVLRLQEDSPHHSGDPRLIVKHDDKDDGTK